MYIVTSVTDLLSGLRQALHLAETHRDDPDNRRVDTAFYKGEIHGLKFAIELAEALLSHQQK